MRSNRSGGPGRIDPEEERYLHGHVHLLARLGLDLLHATALGKALLPDGHLLDVGQGVDDVNSLVQRRGIDLAQKVLHAHLSDADDDHGVQAGGGETAQHESDAEELRLAPVPHGRSYYEHGRARDDDEYG